MPPRNSLLQSFILFNTLRLVDHLSINREHELLQHIFINSSSNARPAANSSTAITVKFGIELVQLISVNERSQSITTKMWVRQIWTNTILRWNPEDWGGVAVLNVDAEKVWKPDIVLYNNAGDTFAGGTEKYKTLVNLHPDGTHTWLAPTTFTSTCKINVKHFPFDEQTCKVKFGSWAFDATKVTLAEEGSPLITGQYLNSSEWDLLGVRTDFHSVLYSCCKEEYQDLTFTFVFRRRPLYYILNVISPCVVLVSMVLFNFLLPPESGERLSLNITVMLALAVFLQFLSDALPRNSDSTPILSMFFITLLTESACALIMTVLILSIHHKGEEKNASRPPRWARKIFLDFVAYRFPPRRTCSSTNLIHNLDIEEQTSHKSAALLKRIEAGSRAYCTSHDDVIMYSLQDILKGVNKINQAMLDQDEQDKVNEEWKMLGKALDRLLFWIFVIVFLGSALVTLIQVYRRDE